MKRILLGIMALLVLLVPAKVNAQTQTEYVDAKVRGIVQELRIADADDYHKVEAINDWMFANCKYKQGFGNDSAYKLLTAGQSNCRGFCMLFIRLCDEVGVKADYVWANNHTHEWNVVMLQGKWYFVDVCSESYMNNKRMMFLKGSKNFYHKMSAKINIQVSESDYKYIPEAKDEEPVKPVETPAEEVTPKKPNKTDNGLFSFSKSVPSFGSVKDAVKNAGFNWANINIKIK